MYENLHSTILKRYDSLFIWQLFCLFYRLL